MACTGITCNQGRAGCDLTCENSKPRRTCAELGVCQNRTPPCRDDCLPILHQRNSDGTDPEQASNHPWDCIDDLSYPLDRALLIAVASAIVAIPYLLFH